MYEYERRKKLKKNPFYNNSDSIENIHDEENRPLQRYISCMGSMSHTYGNALAFIQKYILDIFPEGLFKTVHVNSKIAHRQIRNTKHEFLKKEKPMIIFRPRIGDYDEDRFMKNTLLTERQYDLYHTWGGGSLQPFFQSTKHDLRIDYLQNRSILYVDVVVIFSTLMNQIDYVHYLENAIRWNHNIMLDTCLESFIPQEMLKVLSDLVGIPLYDHNGSTKEFLTFMEQNSCNPVTYKIQGSTGTSEFYRYYPVRIDTLFSGLSWDDGEKIDHVASKYQINFSVRMEFWSTGFYYLFSDNLKDINMPTISVEEGNKIIPVFTDVYTKEDLNLQPGWHVYNSVSCRLENPNDTMNLDQLLNDSIRYVMKIHRDEGTPFVEFLDIKIRRQGELMHEGLEYAIDYNTMDLHFIRQNTYCTYKVLICINVEYINDLAKKAFNLK